MKNKDDVEKRLRKLRTRYAHKYVQQSQERRFCNCSYNQEVRPNGPYAKSVSVENEIAPRQQVTLLVLRDESAAHMCMYKADDPALWEGNLCEDDGVAKACPYFKPRVDAGAAKDEFMELVSDDEYVFDNYRDVATLQWVLGERVHTLSLSWWERLGLWLRVAFTGASKPAPRLPEASIPEDLWNDPPPNP